jgi:hypothetical protein
MIFFCAELPCGVENELRHRRVNADGIETPIAMQGSDENRRFVGV